MCSFPVPASLRAMLCSSAGFVRTDMTRHSGLIDVDQAVEGMISVLESDLPLNGRWWVSFRPLSCYVKALSSFRSH